MEFDIDVSGEDILNKDTSICIANKDSVIKGFKISGSLSEILNSRFGQGLYRYHKSKSGRASFKVRIYCIVIYQLFKTIKVDSVCLNICRDFSGKEESIKSNLSYFLGDLLGIKIEKISFCRLDADSNAHKYAFLMRKDTKNKMNIYLNMSLNEIEKYLKK